MDDYWELGQYRDNEFRNNGEEVHGQFDTNRGFDPNGFCEGNEIRDSNGHRDSASGKLFVGGVSWETTEENFSSYFGRYGEVADSVIMFDKHSGRPRGFGFVTFANPAVADKVLEEDHVIDGRMVEVKRTVPRKDMEVKAKGVSKTKKIFVGGIPPSLTNGVMVEPFQFKFFDELRDYFSIYGGILDYQIMLDYMTGRSRGFGFVTFEKEDAVEQIFSERKIHELGGKQVEIKRAEPKRAGGDYNGNATNSYGGFGCIIAGHDGGYNHASRNSGKMARSYGGYGVHDVYGNFGGTYGGNYAGFYSGYGGYYYGFGYGGAGLVGSDYGMLGGYGVATAYGGGKGYGNGAGDSLSLEPWSEHDRPGDSMAGRYHPYRK